MDLQIFRLADCYRIHNAACITCQPEDVSPVDAGHFASQQAVFLDLWGCEILLRQIQSDDLMLTGDHAGSATVKSVTDLWYRTVFMPCTDGLRTASSEDLEALAAGDMDHMINHMKVA